MKETLPIKFFAKREEDKQRVEGGGKKELPKWVLHDEELYEKSVALSRVINDVLEEENWNERNIPVIIEAKLNRNAHAKSHRRKIENIFFTDKNNVIGVTDENTLVIRVDSQTDGAKIEKKISDVKNNAYGISGIDNIMKYKPIVYKSEGISNYKVKLFNFNDFSTNKSHKAKFEMFLRNERIEFIETNYTKSLIIYKLCNMSNLQIDKLINNTLFDLAEEFVPMPYVSINLDALNKKDVIKIKNIRARKKVRL